MPSEVALIDANVLIALSFADHEHHVRARAWLGERRFATTPTVQGALVRYATRVATPAHAAAVLDALNGHDRHEFWPDDVPFDREVLRGVMGHRQVTDVYITAIAVRHGARVATFDAGLSALRPESRRADRLTINVLH